MLPTVCTSFYPILFLFGNSTEEQIMPINIL